MSTRPVLWIDPSWDTADRPHAYDVATHVGDTLRTLLHPHALPDLIVSSELEHPDHPARSNTTVTRLYWTDGPSIDNVAALLTGSPDARAHDLQAPLTGTGPHRVLIRPSRSLTDPVLLTALTGLHGRGTGQDVDATDVEACYSITRASLPSSSVDPVLQRLWADVLAREGVAAASAEDLADFWQTHAHRIADLRRALA